MIFLRTIYFSQKSSEEEEGQIHLDYSKTSRVLVGPYGDQHFLVQQSTTYIRTFWILQHNMIVHNEQDDNDITTCTQFHQNKKVS